MEEKQTKDLIDNYLSGNCSEQEKAVVETWFNVQASKKENTRIADFQAMNKRIMEGLPEGSLVQTKKAKLWPRWVAAASIVMAVLTGSYFYYQEQPISPKATNVYTNDVTAGKNGATLTLANGQKILINDALAGNIVNEAGVKITKTAKGEIFYEVTGNNSKILTYHTLTTTRGEQAQVRLPDGTLVFLNSASSLKYPTIFGKERNVELSGEAYFQVAHNKQKPFNVASNGQQVKVLGTHFNINSYADEKVTKTTLLEGAVRLSSLREGTIIQSQVLEPGQQAILSPAGALKVEQVNADEVIAWTDGKFIFDSESIESIMRKLSRWYDVEVVYEGNVKDRQFAGTISRKDNISKILDKITFTQSVHFKIEGRRVTVMP